MNQLGMLGVGVLPGSLAHSLDSQTCLAVGIAKVLFA